MTLTLLLKDEFRHLARNRPVVIMLSLLPVLMAAVGSMGVGGEGMPPLFFAAAMGSNIAGMVCGALVAASLIGELQQGTPVLFAVRPVPRSHLLLARFLALVLLLTGAMALSLALSVGITLVFWPGTQDVFPVVRSGLAITVSAALLSGSFGVLVGVTANTLLSGILLFLFVGSNLNNGVSWLLQKLPEWTGWGAAATEGVVLLGVAALSAALLAISARVFSRRPL
jgi:ABC-type transport system involved in multi-copper enzyme maturation permease subunit